MMVNRWEDQDEVPGAEKIPGGGHSAPGPHHSSLHVAQKTENLPCPGRPAVRESRGEQQLHTLFLISSSR